MAAWKTLEASVILDCRPFLTVESHRVELPDGQVIPDWTWIRTPDFVSILAQTDSGQFLCFRQEKYGIDGLSLAVPGGFLESGEEPLSGARRELQEETGFEAREWIPLGSYRVDPNRGAGTAYFFLALGACRTGDCLGGDLERQELILLDSSGLETALSAGGFKALSWTATVSLGLHHLDRIRRSADGRH